MMRIFAALLLILGCCGCAAAPDDSYWMRDWSAEAKAIPGGADCSTPAHPVCQQWGGP